MNPKKKKPAAPSSNQLDDHETPSSQIGTAVVASNQLDNAPAVIGPTLSQTLRAYIDGCGIRPEFKAESPEQRRQELRRARDSGLASNIIQGYWLAQIKAVEGPEAMRATCADMNIGRSSAYNAIGQFELFNQVSDLEAVQALSCLEPTKVLALGFDAAQLEEFARGESVRGVTLDAAANLPVRDLVDLKRQWEAEHDDQLRKASATIATLQTQLETERNEKTRLIRAGAYAQAEEDLPAFARTVRHEAMALTEQMSFCLDGLQAVFEAHLLNGKGKVGEYDARPVAANTFFYALAGIHARAEQLLSRVREDLGDVISGTVNLASQLSPAELARFMIERDRLLAVHQHSTKQREIERENSTPGKRGAKRKGGK